MHPLIGEMEPLNYANRNEVWPEAKFAAVGAFMFLRSADRSFLLIAASDEV